MSKRVLKSNFKKSHKHRGGENLCDTYTKKQEEYINIYNHEADKINKIRTKSADILSKIKKVEINSLTKGKKAQEYLDKNTFERLSYRMELYDTVLVDVINLIKESLALLKSTASGQLVGGTMFIQKMNSALNILEGGLPTSGSKSDLRKAVDITSDLYKEIRSLVDQSKVMMDKNTTFIKSYIEDVKSKLSDSSHPNTQVKGILLHIQLELFPESESLSNESIDESEFNLEAEIEKIGRPFDAEVFKPIDKFLLDNYQHTCFTPIEELVAMVDNTIDNSINAINKIFDKVQKVVPRVENIIMTRVKERIDRVKGLMETCSTTCLKPLTAEEMKQQCAKITCVPKKYTIYDEDEEEDLFGECGVNDKECKQIRDICNYSYKGSLEGKEVCPDESGNPTPAKKTIDFQKAAIAAKAVDDLNKDVENVRANKETPEPVENEIVESEGTNDICFYPCALDNKGNYLGSANTCDEETKEHTKQMSTKYKEKFGAIPEKGKPLSNGIKICKDLPCLPKCAVSDKGKFNGVGTCPTNSDQLNDANRIYKKYGYHVGVTPAKVCSN